jgi:hypothetical protein
MPAIRCPKCKARYKVPASAGGRKTACKHCGQKFRIPQFSAAATPPPPPPPPSAAVRHTEGVSDGSNLYDDLQALSAGGVLEMKPAAPAVPDDMPPEAIPSGADIEYAAGEVAPPPATKVDFLGYLRAIAQSALFMMQPGDIITFVFLVLVVCIGDFLLIFVPGGLGLLGAFVCHGWYWAFMLNIVQDAAAGEEGLPTMSMTEGWWGDIFAPLLKMVLVTLVAFAPCIASALAAGMLLPQFGAAAGTPLMSTTSDALFITLIAAGAALWPVLVLVIACGGPLAVFRLDLILMTIVKSFPAYVLMVSIVMIAIAISFWQSLYEAIVGDSIFVGPWNLGRFFLTMGMTNLVGTYCFIVVMRAIGLYYHHFKSRFAWDWG